MESNIEIRKADLPPQKSLTQQAVDALHMVIIDDAADVICDDVRSRRSIRALIYRKAKIRGLKIKVVERGKILRVWIVR